MRSIRAVADIAQEDAAMDGAYQWAIDQFVDDFRTSSPAARHEAVAQAPAAADGRLSALLAGIVDALCGETGSARPAWMASVGVKSPHPFFVMRPDGRCPMPFAFAQMLRSPPAFFSRDVFVPFNYLSRA
jgi:hypothetical protein